MTLEEILEGCARYTRIPAKGYADRAKTCKEYLRTKIDECEKARKDVTQVQAQLDE